MPGRQLMHCLPTPPHAPPLPLAPCQNGVPITTFAALHCLRWDFNSGLAVRLSRQISLLKVPRTHPRGGIYVFRETKRPISGGNPFKPPYPVSVDLPPRQNRGPERTS